MDIDKIYVINDIERFIAALVQSECSASDIDFSKHKKPLEGIAAEEFIALWAEKYSKAQEHQN